MQYTIRGRIVQLALIRLHCLVVLSILVLTLLGRMPDSQAGWLVCPPQVVVGTSARRWRGERRRTRAGPRTARWRHLYHTAHLPVARSLLLGVLWDLSRQPGPAWVILIPCGVWLWQSAGVLCPWLRRQPEWRAVNWLLGQAQRGLMVGYLGLH